MNRRLQKGKVHGMLVLWYQKNLLNPIMDVELTQSLVLGTPKMYNLLMWDLCRLVKT